jgi:hypothetical protein
MPRASVLAAVQQQAKKKDDEDEDANESEDEEERRDDIMGTYKSGIMGSYMGKTMGGNGEMFRTQGGSLRRRERGSNDAIGSTVSQLPARSCTPTTTSGKDGNSNKDASSSHQSFESRRAQAPRGNRDSVETSFKQLLEESSSDGAGGGGGGGGGEDTVGRCATRQKG